ncbi:T-cell surface protein tactile [Neolamprologus brichardi]|uniref:T-cell surface protein tactile n=1 Tax=Neolamprologus brichardi TaxID=32507 RepID=UPI0003EBEA44|nr:T-cell surface protein tactile [Neolamprologus brichardi]
MSLKMAGNALGIVFCLLLLASTIRGIHGVELFHYEKMEAVVGQNVSLPCTLKSATDNKIVSIEWRKENTKLGLYSQFYGIYLFWQNITIQIEKNGTDVLGSHLKLSDVKKSDEGIYDCDMATFPAGSRQVKTQLIIKDDIKITCDVNGTVEVHNGENVTIRCTSFPNAEYTWTKNDELLSETGSLELWWVTDANAGVYTLTVNTGSKSVRKEFVVTVLTTTTSLKTVSPQGLTESAGISLTTSPTPELSTHTDRTTFIATNARNTTNVTITADEHITSFTNSTHISVTASPTTHSHTQDLLNTTVQRTTESGYPSTMLTSTQESASDETRNETEVHTEQPEGISSATPEEYSTTGNIFKSPDRPSSEDKYGENENKDTAPIHLLLVVIIVPVLVLIAVAGFLFRRQVIKTRLDSPPSFKPPPPPVKYTAIRQSKTLTESFPISRCNSLTETQI